MPTLAEALEPHYKTYNMKDLIERLSALTPTETLELVAALETKWNVNATTTAQVVPVPSVQLVAEVQTEFSVLVTGIGPNKISVIKEVRALTGLGLPEAKSAVESVVSKPLVVKEGVTHEDATKFAAQLEAVGAVCTIK